MTRPSIYTRPNKPMTIPVRNRHKPTELQIAELPELVAVDKVTECHVTPLDVARRMVKYLGPVGDYMTLEPSAGTGQLVKALLESGHSSNELCAVERHTNLASGLHSLKCGVVNDCFLEWSERVPAGSFSRIIMNPPFSQVRKHMAAALSLLGQGGHQEPATLVCSGPLFTYQHDETEELERLPVDTFATARVHTKNNSD